jgi:hypothetical protein
MKSKVEEKADMIKEMNEKFDFEGFQCKTLQDIEVWNNNVRKAHRIARLHDKHAQPPYPLKVPDESYYKKIRVKFQRFDQPENVLKVRVRTKEIDWTGQLKPGRIYDLPMPVIKFLNKLAVPVFAEVKVEDGGETKSETKQVGERSRFSCQLVDMVD